MIVALELVSPEDAMLEITGGLVSAVTVTVVWAVTDPALFVAVSVYTVVAAGVIACEVAVTVPIPGLMEIEVAPVTTHDSVAD